MPTTITALPAQPDDTVLETATNPVPAHNGGFLQGALTWMTGRREVTA